MSHEAQIGNIRLAVRPGHEKIGPNEKPAKMPQRSHISNYRQTIVASFPPVIRRVRAARVSIS
jgi:hypothetical protein